MKDIEVSYSGIWKVNPYPGLLVDIEGLDGSGQSTQVDALFRHFSDNSRIKIAIVKEPTDGPIGAQIRAALGHRLNIDLETLQLAFSADRADDLNKKNGIIDRLKLDYFVILDRFSWSTLAYGFASGLDVNYLTAVQSKFLLPDLTFYLSTPVEVCLERMSEKRLGMDLFETQEQLEKVSQGYRMLMTKYPEHIIEVDGQKNPEKIAAAIRLRIRDHEKFKRISVRQT